MLSSWRMYEMHLALFLKAGCDSNLYRLHNPGIVTNPKGVVVPCTSWSHFVLAPHATYGTTQGAVKHDFWVMFQTNIY
jgi:hypothetical protein